MSGGACFQDEMNHAKFLSWDGLVHPQIHICLSLHWHQHSGDPFRSHPLQSLCARRAGAGAPAAGSGLYFLHLKVGIFFTVSVS